MGTPTPGEKAQELLETISRCEVTVQDAAAVLAASAQVYAVLEVARQQEIANLIALGLGSSAKVQQGLGL